MTENTPAPFERETRTLEEVCDIAVNVESLTSENTFELVLLKLAGYLLAAQDAGDSYEAHTIESTLNDVASAFQDVQADQETAAEAP